MLWVETKCMEVWFKCTKYPQKTIVMTVGNVTWNANCKLWVWTFNIWVSWFYRTYDFIMWFTIWSKFKCVSKLPTSVRLYNVCLMWEAIHRNNLRSPTARRNLSLIITVGCKSWTHGRNEGLLLLSCRQLIGRIRHNVFRWWNSCNILNDEGCFRLGNLPNQLYVLIALNTMQ